MKRYKFVGSCDRVRRTPKGEEFWQNMYTKRRPIDEDKFLRLVKVSDLLDPDETWQQWLETAYDAKFYQFVNGAFVKTHGFEFIFYKYDL